MLGKLSLKTAAWLACSLWALALAFSLASTLVRQTRRAHR